MLYEQALCGTNRYNKRMKKKKYIYILIKNLSLIDLVKDFLSNSRMWGFFGREGVVQTYCSSTA